ncbi:MAG: redoxin domain-containing protein [Deltaproteobacteria bacterium]|nr:redoxin domain-containing protein [Deltaproteobacteria bacterium]
MKKHSKTVILLLMSFWLLSGVTAQSSALAQIRSNALEIDAPDFVLNDLKGRKFKLSDYKGKPVLIIFSTTWCAYCRSEIPHFKSIYSTYGPKGLVVINIDIEESKEKVARFAARYQLPYRVLLDEDGSVSDAYRVMGVPSMTLIDKKGKLFCLYCRNMEPLLDKLFEETNKPAKK